MKKRYIDYTPLDHLLLDSRGVPRVNLGRGGVAKMRPPPPSLIGKNRLKIKTDLLENNSFDSK